MFERMLVSSPPFHICKRVSSQDDFQVAIKEAKKTILEIFQIGVRNSL